ncbi:universal stress protein [uncultured Ferrovibrio sp.]|jgi:nucleotide-binding universal stress UspA family protein|uniref:universal stress protein n=1 Tax=uncultured Ferrovibrio sp. TaxID=1576913 RepID=UPI00260ADDE7|nr:universal stress protein [uncultured Ferrovibrio sp.]
MQSNTKGFSRILVASDLTANTDRAFDRAVLLAETSGASLCVLHAVDADILPERYINLNLREAQASLERELRDAELPAHIQTTLKVVPGKAPEAILQEAGAMSADLIVMGVSTDLSLTGLLRGTTIDKVVRRAPCPALVVKVRPRRPYRHVAIAVDLGAPSRQALDLALGKFPGAKFCVLHVDETGDAAKAEERRNLIADMVTARCATAGCGVPGKPGGPELVFGSGRATAVLQEQIDRLDPDLVVIGTHGKDGVGNVLLGSVAEAMLDLLRCDVMALRG